jgi:hypothetical protein
MTQEQVLDHEILARAYTGQDGREQQRDQFKHALSIADLRLRGVLPLHSFRTR